MALSVLRELLLTGNRLNTNAVATKQCVDFNVA